MKAVTQISISMPNTPGKMAEVTGLLHDNGVSIIALYVNADADKGTARMITSDPEKTVNTLSSFDFGISEDNAVAAQIPEHPGGFLAILKTLQQGGINIEYLYNASGIADKEIVVLGLDDAEKGVELLEKNWIKCYGDELYRM